MRIVNGEGKSTLIELISLPFVSYALPQKGLPISEARMLRQGYLTRAGFVVNNATQYFVFRGRLTKKKF
jgi:hypothetical protein